MNFISFSCTKPTNPSFSCADPRRQYVIGVLSTLIESDPKTFSLEISCKKKEKKAKKYPTDEQVRTVLKSIDGEKNLYLEILRETGARPGEGLQIAREDVSIDQPPCPIILWTCKMRGGGRTPRKKIIGPDLALKLRKWREQNGESVYVFQQDGQEKPRVYGWAVDVQELACKNAKIKYFTLHGWRHFYASKLAGQGKSLIEIRKINLIA